MEYVKGMLSIICGCYNHEKFIEDCIQSIWDNDYKNVEIIVLDDGSTDRSVEILNRLKEKSPCPFEIIAQENTFNLGLNGNRQLAVAKGEFVTFMLTDDWYTKDAFSKKLNIMNENPDIAFSVSRYLKFKIMDNQEEICDQIGTMFTNESSIDELIELEYERDTFSVQGMIIRREIMDYINGFDEDIQGDDIILRIKILRYMQKHPKWKFYLINDPSFVYRVHGNNYSNNKEWITKIYLDVFDRYWADRPYNDRVISGTCTNMDKLGFKAILPILSQHPRCINLLIENERFARNFMRELNKYLNKKSLIDYIFKKDEYYERNIYTIFNFIKISHKVKTQK